MMSSIPTAPISNGLKVSWRLSTLISFLIVYGPFVIEALYAAISDYRNYIHPKDWMLLPAAPCVSSSFALLALLSWFRTSVVFCVVAVVVLLFLIPRMKELRIIWKLPFFALCLCLCLIIGLSRWLVLFTWTRLGFEVNSNFDLFYFSTVLSVLSVIAVTFLVRRVDWLRSLYLSAITICFSASAVFYYHLIRA